jgi:hypothetical protein
MGRAVVVIMTVVLAATAGLAACTGVADHAPAARQSDDPQAVSHLGLAGIRFGDRRADLERDHGLVQGTHDCAPRLPAYPQVSPVFEGDRLVLLWVDPPLGTATGVTVGDPVAHARDTHPEAEELTAPAGSFRFDGLIATVDEDRAYLFLHDHDLVQKVVVGFEEHARRLFHDGFGTC